MSRAQRRLESGNRGTFFSVDALYCKLHLMESNGYSAVGLRLTSVQRELRIESLRRVYPRGVLQGDTASWDISPVG
jgi:hypothetical protein